MGEEEGKEEGGDGRGGKHFLFVGSLGDGGWEVDIFW